MADGPSADLPLRPRKFLIDTFTFLGQLATLVMALLVLLTLLEMRKQRRSTYRPELVLIGPSFNAYVTDHGTPDLWSLTRLDPDTAAKTHPWSSRPSLRIYNVGLGACKEFKTRWHFPKLIEALTNPKAAELSGQIPVISSPEENYLRIKYPGDREATAFMDLSDGLVHLAEYILPVSVDPTGLAIPFPTSYQELVSIHILREILSHKGDSDSIPLLGSFCEARVELEYRDIENKKHTKSYDLSLKMTYLSMGDLSVGQHIFSGSTVISAR